MKYFIVNHSLISIIILSIINSGGPSWDIQNPYKNVDWTNDGRHKGNFHTHTTLSDGRMNPQTVVEKYHDLGYSILAITDHNRVAYPWMEFSQMQPYGRYYELGQIGLENGLIQPEDLVYENRNPVDLDMIAVKGNELTHHNHMISLFSDYDAGNTSHIGTGREDLSLRQIASDNGLAFWAHPMGNRQREKVSQLTRDTVGWYVELYHHYDHLLGQEINNRHDDYVLWDSTLARMMPDRSVWGFSNDDMHTLSGLGRRWNLLMLPQLSEEWVHRGLREGRFFFVFAPEGHDGPSPPMIDSISVHPFNGTIQIHASGHRSVQWISGGNVVHEGGLIDLNKIPDAKQYVRAVIYGDGGTYIGTQPFGISLRSSDSSGESASLFSQGSGVNDIDGNSYGSVIIGGQEWMSENLKTTRYRDGSSVEYPGFYFPAWTNNTAGAYAWYYNDEEQFKGPYGALYNWHAVVNEAGLCPSGWRVPDDEDWIELEIHLGMDENEARSAGWRGGSDGVIHKLKSTREAPDEHPRWIRLIRGVNNAGGFSVLPAGYRSTGWASFVNLGRSGYFWTATELNPENAWSRKFEHEFPDITRFALLKNHGFSVRCIKE